MKKLSLTKHLIGCTFVRPGLIMANDGTCIRCFESDPLSSGSVEEGFEGPTAQGIFSKLSDLITRLPNLFDGQIILYRQPANAEIFGLESKLLIFERVRKPDSYSHFNALLEELNLQTRPVELRSWNGYLSTLLGVDATQARLPDLKWLENSVEIDDNCVRALSLTELPQVTWNACLQSLYERSCPFVLSLKIHIPDRKRVKRQLEAKRRVSHALSISSSLELQNIESNAALSSSEETLERILVHKETLCEASLAVFVSGSHKLTKDIASEMERAVSGIGNAGLFTERIGTLPVIVSHMPGAKTLAARKLPVLSENLAHLLPIFLDFNRSQDRSNLPLRSRSGEVCNLNLFSPQNLNFNGFICGASGSGKSFLMNALIDSALADEPNTKILVFDIGESYRRVVQAKGGQTKSLTHTEAQRLLAQYLRTTKVTSNGFFKVLIESLCGSGSHITHSHKVAIDDLVRHFEGKHLEIVAVIAAASSKPEQFYQDIAHWLKPHVHLDDLSVTDTADYLSCQISCFDFKQLEEDPVLQRTTILLLTECIWAELLNGRFPRTIIVYDEVWRFFEQCKSFLEEMYRTFRKYRAGIVSITQNVADYGDDAFAKMIFTTSYTRIFLQNGASASYLKQTFDMEDSNVSRAVAVASKKGEFSEFFVTTANMNQICRLYPTKRFYELANTENVVAERSKNENDNINLRPS